MIPPAVSLSKPLRNLTHRIQNGPIQQCTPLSYDGVHCYRPFSLPTYAMTTRKHAQ